MPRIEEMFAFVAEDSGPGDEGVIAANLGGTWMPLVSANLARIESLRETAVQIGRLTGKRIRLLRFSHRVEVETIYSPEEGSDGHR